MLPLLKEMWSIQHRVRYVSVSGYFRWWFGGSLWVVGWGLFDCGAGEGGGESTGPSPPHQPKTSSPFTSRLAHKTCKQQKSATQHCFWRNRGRKQWGTFRFPMPWEVANTSPCNNLSATTDYRATGDNRLSSLGKHTPPESTGSEGTASSKSLRRETKCWRFRYLLNYILEMHWFGEILRKARFDREINR